MIRRIFRFASSVVICSVLISLTGTAKEVLDIQEVLQKYNHNVQVAHRFQGTFLYQGQQMHYRPVQDSFKDAIEQYYFIPKLDPIYSEHEHLFLKSFYQLEWNIELNGQRMIGNFQILESFTDFLQQDPLVHKQQESIQKVKTVPGEEVRFSIVPPQDNTPPQDDISSLFIPDALVQCHYLPSFWYPSPQEYGFPQDVDTIDMRGGGNESYAFIYHPENLPTSLIEYLRDLAKNNDLQEKDLRIILAINPEHFTCKSLTISIEKDDKPITLFSISHTDVHPSATGFAIPYTSVLYTTRAAESEGKVVWGSDYFFQLSLKTFMLQR